MGITIKDVDASNIDDVFKVCSHDRLEEPLQKRGIELKRRWLTRMLDEHTHTPPSDFGGVVYIPYDRRARWKLELVKELRACGIDVDANKIV